ncbi:hypothetical protein QJS04_geneDACA016762 [Acorus gramineus]|uniref:FAD-binding domain-containing protein n=1 Tax=Acorus gramineus TaxID=55184 RepID=A0AAV9BE55_ACOGR|nr:hypothetical protein QJS04_geneDACA016762 [Acorus gramineus]
MNSSEHEIVIAGGGICGLVTALALHRYEIVDLYDGRQREEPVGKGELRSFKRSDLVHTLANHLSHETILFVQWVISIKTNPEVGFSILHCVDGTVINCKILIGCERVNSIVAKSLGLKAPRNLSTCAIRAYTSYPNGHGFTNEFIRMTRGDGLNDRLNP